MNEIRIICRKSTLSRYQAQKVMEKLKTVFPKNRYRIIEISTKGDIHKDVPLTQVPDTDFFTKEVYDALQSGSADIAVHSLKDLSAEHFFSHGAFAAIEREDARDFVIFNPEVINKIAEGKEIIIGTCSPRREDMALQFLDKALPVIQGKKAKLKVKPIRGNVEQRFRKLHEREYDGIILAVAGVNRLLTISEPDNEGLALLQNYLPEKRLMFLPLIECVPAPCQGIIVAEADPGNEHIGRMISAINDEQLMHTAITEKTFSLKYGSGCNQRFGATTFLIQNHQFTYAAGTDKNGTAFQIWSNLSNPIVDPSENLFDSTVFMKDFFINEPLPATIEKVEGQVFFITNKKIASQPDLLNQINDGRIWTAGTSSWFALAEKGLWVEGCADALGMEQLHSLWHSPVLSFPKEKITILTHEEAAQRRRNNGYRAIAVYRLTPTFQEKVTDALKQAKYVFWSSYMQYQYYSRWANSHAVHLCAGGETANQLKKHGIEPVIFPTIKSFQEWKA
ncbi:MAG: hydroxymethylbilane synthase [Chitinophagaceae bacterium]|nr:hydroxymethylbilane synthase [Chitinophagaceae bacterium]